MAPVGGIDAPAPACLTPQAGDSSHKHCSFHVLVVFDSPTSYPMCLPPQVGGSTRIPKVQTLLQVRSTSGDLWRPAPRGLVCAQIPTL